MRFRTWLADHRKLTFDTYESLWRWSVDDTDAFWRAIMEYFSIAFDGHPKPVSDGTAMPETQWFPDVSLSYAEHVFRQRDDASIALIARNERGSRTALTWKQLRQNVAGLQGYLDRAGIKTGDRVVAFLPNVPEATISFLAANGLGCTWSSCSPDFGINAVEERFAQIEPRVLIACTGYGYNGRSFDTTSLVKKIVAALPTVTHVVLVDREEEPGDTGRLSFDGVQTTRWDDILPTDSDVVCKRVPFNHPIWVLYSSGTTGKPKAIVHSTGGILLEQFKYCSFHNDFKPGERCFWFTTTGWMMWNYIHGALLTGSVLMLYDGNPAYPDLMTLWRMADEEGIAHFGTSAAFILACMHAGISPGETVSLNALRSIGATGSTLPPEGFRWIYHHVKQCVWLASMSGGTDICSAFVGGNPTLPVYAGEIQCRALGCSLYAYNDNGRPVVDEVGEMVITRSMPSMPVFFWGDPGYIRYRESYFEMYPGIWRHGDWIQVTSRGSIVIYGRSDATLNRGGVRIGTSEVYSAVSHVNEVRDSLIICVEKPGGQFWMPLFVVLRDGVLLSDGLKAEINNALRTRVSPRHVPDEIIAVPDIPYTISGKKTETPVKKLFQGFTPGKALNRDVLRNPTSLDAFIALAARLS